MQRICYSEYHAVTTLAAKMERTKRSENAGQLWLQAMFLAKSLVNVEYCRNRAEFCKKNAFMRERV